jgi:ATP-dependent helicase/nuclease subunit B
LTSPNGISPVNFPDKSPIGEVCAEAARRPRVFTIAPGRPFLTSLATAILDGNLPVPGGARPSPIELAGYTLFLPTRRATRALQQAFLDASGGVALLLPKVRAIGDDQIDASLLSNYGESNGSAGQSPTLAPAVSSLERCMALTSLILKWSQITRQGLARQGNRAPPLATNTGTSARAAKLAGELALLMDAIENENVSLDTLDKLVPEMFADHWALTLDFLKTVIHFWPQYLHEKGLLSAADRRNRLILAEAERLRTTPPARPVIVAGVSGSVPATATLMAAVAAMPLGAVVLCGLDQVLDEPSWQSIVPAHPEHPQYGLKRLLDQLGITRRDVELFPGGAPTSTAWARHTIISEAMRPAGTTQLWPSFAGSADHSQLCAALSGLSYLEAPTAQDEAEAIALILREVTETPGRTAALVSRDRLLARRVAVRLEAWGVRVDDSAGRPLTKTPPGTLLDLAVDAIAFRFEPIALMALLKHPLTRLGLGLAEVRRAARALELAAFRAPYFGVGLEGVEAALDQAATAVAAAGPRHRAVRRLKESDWRSARALIARLKQAFAPITSLFDRQETIALRSLVAAHIAAAEALVRRPQEEGSSQLWQGEAGEVAALFFTKLLDTSLPPLHITPADYPDLYRCLARENNVRSRVPAHSRISIWGPFEARLQQPDVVILGSLNEGTWPAAADPGPWLNRPMRQQLGLPAPEAEVGRSAHDFSSLLGAERVYLTRAAKIDGVPTVPSRWLMRLTALLGGMGLISALDPDQPWLAWGRVRDRIGERRIITAPQPTPPVALRPRHLSVTRVEGWIANPYSIFARYILSLEPLEALGKQPDAALKGAIIHQALGRFTARFPDKLPANAEAELLQIASEILSEYAGPRVAAFWLPRVARFAAWFGETEPERRRKVSCVLAEVSGVHVIAAPAGPFTLTARADRIDVSADGLAIVDYKTGQMPSDSRVRSGAAPQLPLEAAIAQVGGFAGLEPSYANSLSYIRITGGEPAGETRQVKVGDVSQLARFVLDGLARLISHFDRPGTPYRALRRPDYESHYRFDDYAHLARVSEWLSQTDDEEG